MQEERRNGLVDLETKLDAHIEDFEDFRDDLLTVIAGPRDPLTGERRGGMRGAIIEVANGGINTKWSFWQKIAVGATPFLVGGGFAVVTSLIEKQ